ncbi:MAG: UDP-N-acetylglucosamine 4,6-dehydratase (inverting) [Candidatus Niyogibacteria bacterium]|nr:UDP-N-acetylglucosamine 4,6-dehydratase (inverting) [Candidatus Niyogibacteria bacterium]
MNNSNLLKDKAILITGGTGSFGQKFVEWLLKFGSCKKIIIFSRDEFKQHQMRQRLLNYDKKLRFFLGDVRDLSRLQRAFNGVDIVVHAAALKQVPALEYNPLEAIKTNILGTQNVVDAAIDQKVLKALLVSTDKAAYPANLYGSTKLCAEKLFVSGGAYAPGVDRATKFSVVRYGNVIGSRGSIVETLLNNDKNSEVHITDHEMTRFWIDYDRAIELVIFALNEMVSGEIFVPKIPSMKLVDLFDALVPHAPRKTIGIRSGEKIHEILLTAEEAKHSVEVGRYFVILPEFPHWTAVKRYEKYLKKGKELKPKFCFTSHTNPDWITANDLKKIIKNNIGLI